MRQMQTGDADAAAGAELEPAGAALCGTVTVNPGRPSDGRARLYNSRAPFKPSHGTRFDHETPSS
ncbi:hypothetical protein VFPFJ_03740 [Purpureocillium lilacinum]|uniref:Uncharacterized protein n=1 Tax=Purpureocillium lilacinum TaxID=33203 RepID=A0A179HRD3_PURLI|nr:hypothetical protein VFPFJ_03740 [Purpureocillium lilacinum]OAQ92000.1 hypothetical protein VFPFJ_03740 [Purpureocillium lilacinum]